MLFLKDWEDDLETFTDEKLVYVGNALSVLKTWKMFNTSYSEHEALRLIIICEQENRRK